MSRRAGEQQPHLLLVGEEVAVGLLEDLGVDSPGVGAALGAVHGLDGLALHQPHPGEVRGDC